MSKSAILLAISASLFAGNLSAATITESTNLDFPFVTTGNFPVFLNSFNSNLGTLNSVQLIMSTEVTSSTQVFNDTFMLDPLGNPIFTSLQGVATGTTVVMLNANGFPIYSQALTSTPTPFVIGPAQAGFAQTTAVTTATPNVPSFELSAFTKPGFASLQFSAQQFVVLNNQPIGQFGSVVDGTTVGNFSASILAIYTYTPVLTSILTPEPATSGLLAAACLSILVTRRKRGHRLLA
jgi:hypothetical protein